MNEFYSFGVVVKELLLFYFDFDLFLELFDFTLGWDELYEPF